MQLLERIRSLAYQEEKLFRRFFPEKPLQPEDYVPLVRRTEYALNILTSPEGDLPLQHALNSGDTKSFNTEVVDVRFDELEYGFRIVTVRPITDDNGIVAQKTSDSLFLVYDSNKNLRTFNITANDNKRQSFPSISVLNTPNGWKIDDEADWAATHGKNDIRILDRKSTRLNSSHSQ